MMPRLYEAVMLKWVLPFQHSYINPLLRWLLTCQGLLLNKLLHRKKKYNNKYVLKKIKKGKKKEKD